MTISIVNLREGAQRDVESFLLNNDAFPILENAYLFRGRIQKRSCFSPVGVDGRLKGTIGTTDGAGSLTIGPIVSGSPVGISIEEGISTFIIDGDTLTDPGGNSPIDLLTTGSTTGTLTRTTGVLDTNALTEDVIYIPGLPVMGLCVREVENQINDEQLIAFDTRWTYLFDSGSNDFIFQNSFRVTGDTFVWSGSDSDFFWSTNYFKAFWATNNVAGYHAAVGSSPLAEGDGIRWYDGSGSGQGWSNFNPPITSSTFLNGGLIILPYKGRLLVLNTLEGPDLAQTTRFPQRCRFSQVGTPYYDNAPSGTGTDASAWRSDVVGKGGFIDAPTAEEIVSAEFIKDTLVVYFERSTWQLVYTANETFPFFWQKINTELGAESTFSKIPFDRGILSIGNYGITTCDSVNIARIDQKIPDEVFQIQNRNNGTKRVHGIRDYNAQLAYWTYPILSDEDNESPPYELTYPNQVLIYNYLDGSWAEFDDCFTCFGYFQKFSDITWAQLNSTWESTQFSWNSQVQQARYPDVIAGNQRGFVVIFSQLQQLGQNCPSIPISNITTANHTLYVPNHNFVPNQYVLITSATGTSGINGVIYKILSATVDTLVLDQLDEHPWSGTYTGSGLITHIPNFYIQTKEFNPIFGNGMSLGIKHLDIFMDRTTDGEIGIEVYVSDNSDQATYLDPFVVSTTAETTFQANQQKIWHRVFINSIGSFIQNVFTLSEDQIKDLSIASSDVKIHGLIYYIEPSGRLVYEF